MISFCRVALLLAVFCLSSGLSAKPLQRSEVPQALEPWIDWVMQRNPEASCPVNYDNDARRCVWPGTLELAIDPKGARFEQNVTVLSESRFTLPGSPRQWPSQVRVDGRITSVVNQKSKPTIVLPVGQHQIEGSFDWTAVPNSIQLGGGTGIVKLTVNGEVVVQPDRRKSQLWLRKTGDRQPAKAPEDALSIEVFRQIADGQPLQVNTEIALQVSGKPREISFPQVMLADGIALSLRSRLPARLEPDGSLRIQVRPGKWAVRITERHRGAVDSLRSPQRDGRWPDQEIWVWDAAPEIRSAEVSGPDQIDPRQVSVPSDWQGLPTYKMPAGQAFKIKTLRRGDPTPEPDQFRLSRDLWLDYDGGAFAVRDRIDGRLTSTWRINADDRLQVGQISIDGRPQFITRAGDDASSGVEVRRGRLKLVADSRIAMVEPSGYGPLLSDIPAIGWQHDFQGVKTVLHTPPGWRVLAATGVDGAPGTWLEAWSLYDLFLVLIVAVAAGRLWGWHWALLSGLLLALTWHEPDAPRIAWLAALAPIGLLKAINTTGRLSQVLQVVRGLSLLVLILITLPFVVEQARSTLHPQLESTYNPHAPMHRRASAAIEKEAAEPTAAHDDAENGSTVSAPQESVSSSKYTRRSVKKIRNALKNKARADLRTQQTVDPKAVVQTGPGMPDWKWRSTRLSFNGPVLADQNVSLVMLSPTWRKIWQVTMLVLMGLMIWRLIGWRSGGGKNGSWHWQPAAVLLVAVQFTPAEAAEFPPEKLLQELEQRLLEQPTAAPRAALPAMDIKIDSERLDLTLQVQTLQRTAVPLPADMRRLMPSRILLNGEPAGNRTLSDDSARLWILVPEGQHAITLAFQLPQVNQFELALPLVPNNVVVEQTGWQVSGLNQDGVPGAQLTFVREQKASAAALKTLRPTDLPPLLSVVRTLRLGLTWQIETKVTRISPRGAPISVSIPLLDGESVITEKVSVKDHQVQARFSARAREFKWQSVLTPDAQITLKAPDNPTWNETWQLEASPIWRVEPSGIAPVFHQDSKANWLPTWKPWAGETVTLDVSRPAGIGGQSKTIDKVKLRVTPGIRAVDTTLEFTLRSSRGDQHTINLPDQAVLQQVNINGKNRSIRPENNQLILPIVPGSQSIRLQWREDRDIQTQWRGPVVNLGHDYVNARIAVSFPKNRWVLWTSGPTLGPAILIWGVLGVMLVLSVILGRLGARTANGAALPLGIISWFLLAVGLSQVTVLAMIVVAAWLFVLQARPALGASVSRWAFNGMQVGIGLLTITALGILLAAVQNGLLGHPDMQVSGYGSSASRFNWYADRGNSILPQVGVISVPLTWYRVLMLSWALWLAWSLLNWLRWGWVQFSDGGLWRPFVRKAKSPGPDTPNDSSSASASVSKPTPADTVTSPAQPEETSVSAATEQARPVAAPTSDSGTPPDLAKLAAEALKKTDD